MTDRALTLVSVHVLYLIVGISSTIWVVRTLRVHGRIFLEHSCKGNLMLADSWSHLLSIGFYLLHIGLLLLAIRFGGRASDLVEAMELLSSKIGAVLIVLAGSHFFYVASLSKNYRAPTPFVKTHTGERIVTADLN